MKKMATAMPNTIPFGKCKAISYELLRIVIEATERGEVADSKPIFNGCDYQGAEIVFKPEFKELLNK